MDTIPGQTYLTRPLVAARYSISERTVTRWTEDESVGFPKAFRVRDRLFFSLTDIEAWERSRAAPSNKKAA